MRVGFEGLLTQSKAQAGKRQLNARDGAGPTLPRGNVTAQKDIDGGLASAASCLWSQC